MESLLDDKVQWVADYINNRYNPDKYKHLNTKSREFKDKADEEFFLERVLQIGIDMLTGGYTGKTYIEEIKNYKQKLHRQLWEVAIPSYMHQLTNGIRAITELDINYRRHWRKYEQI